MAKCNIDSRKKSFRSMMRFGKQRPPAEEEESLIEENENVDTGGRMSVLTYDDNNKYIYIALYIWTNIY